LEHRVEPGTFSTVIKILERQTQRSSIPGLRTRMGKHYPCSCVPGKIETLTGDNMYCVVRTYSYVGY